MDSITRNVRDLEPHEAQPEQPASNASGEGAAQLPDWCNVYEGLSDDEIAELEKTILTRADLTRSFD